MKKRVDEYERNSKLEKLITEINELIGSIEISKYRNENDFLFPQIYVIGTPRCGNTLMMQWIASLNQIGFPSNFMARFYRNPYLGIKLQQMLFEPEYDYRNELGLSTSNAVNFKSNLGKTKGAIEPNEFWYFWRRFIKKTDEINENEILEFDYDSFMGDLKLIHKAFQKPFAMKGNIMYLNINKLNEIYSKSIFIYVKRQLLQNAQSIYEARKKFYGESKYWYGIKPINYISIADKSPFDQIANQVLKVNEQIELQLDLLPEKNKLVVNYEDFCAKPRKVFFELREKLSLNGFEIEDKYESALNFKVSNDIRLTNFEIEQFKNSFNNLGISI
ncbi:MAG: sulfotransferase [Flavobacteriales bacterium]